MKFKFSFLAIFLLTFLIFCFTSCTQNASSNSENTTAKSNKNNDFGQLNPNAPPETIQFGQLIGKWDCTSYDLQQDSTWYKSKAQWIFKYTLNGFAIEDTWIERTSDSTNNTTQLGRDFHGINMRLYNPSLKKWQCVWLDNRQNTISPIWQANYNDSTKELVMQDESLSWKITFFNMKENSFDWNYQVLQDSAWTVVSKIKGAKVK